MDKNRKLKWDKAIKGRKITTTYGENYTAGDDTKGLFQQADDNSWTPVSVGAKFVNTDSPEYRKNGGKLISKKQ